MLDGKRFDEFVGGQRFAVVTAVPLNRSQRDDVDRAGAVVITAPPGTTLAQWLQSGRSSAAAVRPDRTVLTAGRTLSEVLDAVPVFAPPR